MNTTFSLRRVWLLLRYDAMYYRRTLLFALGVLLVLYIVLCGNAFASSDLEHPRQWLPGSLASTCFHLYGFALIGCFVWATQILHHKFTAPGSAPGYLTLPATSAEKAVTLLLDYACLWVGVKVLAILSFYATMGIGALIYPSLHWGLSYFGNGENMPDVIMKVLTRSASDAAAPYLGWDFTVPQYVAAYSVSIATLLYFLNLNFHFRHNGLLKSCLIVLLTYLILFAVVMPIVLYFIAAQIDQWSTTDELGFRLLDTAEADAFMTALMRSFYILLLSTVALPIWGLWALYRNVHRQQIK